MDTIKSRKEVPLCLLRETAYAPGRHQLRIDVPRIDLSGLNLKKSHILTTGLLTCNPRIAVEMQDSQGPQLAIHMMTQVREEAGVFVKTIINPLGQED